MMQRDESMTRLVDVLLSGSHRFTSDVRFQEHVPSHPFLLLCRPSTGQELLAVQRISGSKELDAAARAIESFVWDLYANSKRNSVSVLLLTSGEVTKESTALLRLSKLCRVLACNANNPVEVNETLALLAPPKMIRDSATPTAGALDLQQIVSAQDANSATVNHLVEIAKRDLGAEAVAKHISNEFDVFLNGVTDALKGS